jgi:phage protein D
MNVPKSIFTVFIAGKNVTADISDRLLSVEYTDHSGGEADTISISIENADQKWLNEWWPDKNTEVSLEIGYEGLILNCGKFRADQIDLSGPPDTLTIRGHSCQRKTPYKEIIRT